MSRESEILDEIEKRQSALNNLSEIESRLLDKVVDLDDEILALQARQNELERIVREKVLNVTSDDLKRALDILLHLAQFQGAISISNGKIKKHQPPPPKSGLLSKLGG